MEACLVLLRGPHATSQSWMSAALPYFAEMSCFVFESQITVAVLTLSAVCNISEAVSLQPLKLASTQGFRSFIADGLLGTSKPVMR